MLHRVRDQLADDQYAVVGEVFQMPGSKSGPYEPAGGLCALLYAREGFGVSRVPRGA